MPDRKTIAVAPESEIGRLLDEAKNGPIYLSKEGLLFRLAAEGMDTEDVGDPGAVEQAIDRFTGAWSDVDADRAIADLYRAREQGSRPYSRPE
jgi:hypothetical protein